MSETSTITNVAAGVDNARIVAQLATELGARASQIAAAVELLDDGATVPFIARYRKEATGGLDDTVLRNLEVRLGYLRELEERRGAILESISQQGKLTPELQQEISAADTKQRLEDLYAPYKPKRRTRAQIAREAGLEPLADAILADPACDPAALAAQYLNPEASINDAKAALDGARDILAERYAENADLLADPLLTLLPGLATARTEAGGEVMAALRDDEGFSLAELIGQVALALQLQAGAGAEHVLARPSEGPDEIEILYGYESEEVGLEAGQLACDLLLEMINPREGEDALDFDAEIEDFTDFASRRTLGPSALALVRAARAGPGLEAALIREYRFSARSLPDGDLLEGIRARVIDKDRRPLWRDGIDDVTEARVAAMLAPLPVDWPMRGA